MWRGAMMDLILTTRKSWWGMWSSRTALTTVPMKWWSSSSLGRQGGCTASLLPWTSREQIFGLFRVMLGRVLWDKALKERVAQENWLIFKGHLLQVQEWYTTTNRKLDKNARRLAWMHNYPFWLGQTRVEDLLNSLCSKKEWHQHSGPVSIMKLLLIEMLMWL